MKSILLYANEDPGQEHRLQAALDLGRAHGAHITCIQVTPYASFVIGSPYGAVYAAPWLTEEINRTRTETRTRLEERLRREDVPWSWTEADGDPAQSIVDQSRLADLIVLSLPGAEATASNDALALAGETVVHARSPVLAVPSTGRRIESFGPALVAWNGSPEAAYALRASLPMLKIASAVHVVTVVDGSASTGFPATQASEYLSRHGVNSELREVTSGDRAVGDVVAEQAVAVGAGYIVMGGYGHSRFREAVLGGTTRSLLQQDGIPLLLGR
jgi:nucleotide-binding universal stress UspA family protein